jgi:hypothetical protein
VTTSNYYELFNGILNPKQLEGLRLLLTPFAQQQFNLTADRRSEHPSMGVSCFDCQQNGSTVLAKPLRIGVGAVEIMSSLVELELACFRSL